MAKVKTEEDAVTRVLFICLSGIMGVTAIAGAVLSAVRVQADTTETERVAITVPASCTMSGSGMDSHTATLTPGTYSAASGSEYENGIGSTTLTTFCNDAEGFAIYAVGYTNNTEGNTNLVGNTTSLTIPTKVYESSDTTSNWSMKVNKVTDSSSSYLPDNMNIDNSYNSWHTVPSSFQKVAHYQATTGSSATDATLGAKVTTTYAAYAASTQAADTYTGQVKYVMVHPNSLVAGSYTISYNGNGSDGGTAMSNETGIANYAEHTLAANTYTLTGYNFAGWCTVQDQTASGVVPSADPQTTCTGTSYADEATIPPSTFANNTTVSLYAYWSEKPTFDPAFAAAGKTKYNGYYKMQDANASICSAVDVGTTGTVIDERDDQTYTIGKLADEKCWMLDNLALDIYDSNVLNNLSSANTNIDQTNESAILTSLKSGNRSVGDQYATAGLTAWTSSYSYSVPMANLTNKELPSSYSSSSDPMKDTVIANNWKIGGYYNYCAATAGSYCYGSGTSYGTPSGNATSDICPAGWRMPAGNTTGEYSALANAIYGSTGSTSDATAYANYRNALHIPLSGYFDSGSADGQGSYGYFWSSTRYNSYRMHRLSATTSNIYPAFDGTRDRGLSVRCVLGS